MPVGRSFMLGLPSQETEYAILEFRLKQAELWREDSTLADDIAQTTSRVHIPLRLSMEAVSVN
eukprot:2861679-Amphidinium_carterae.1